jgi:preprotein translocase subunit SecG
MVTFILLGFFFIVAIMLSAMAYASVARKRSGVHRDFPEIPIDRRPRAVSRD